MFIRYGHASGLSFSSTGTNANAAARSSNILGGLIGGSRSVGRSVAVVLFKKLNIETKVNTGHPFPRGGKRIRLYLCAYMNWKLRFCVRSLSCRIGSPILDSRLVSGKLSAWLIDLPFNVAVTIINDVCLMSKRYNFKPYG